MQFLTFALALIVLPSCSATSPQTPLHQSTDHQNGPNKESAIANANHIFNAIHSSMRQWGSSIQHNGMSFFVAHVPENTLLYHGGPTRRPVTGMEWLAFEMEHAEMFALDLPRQPPDTAMEVPSQPSQVDLLLGQLDNSPAPFLLAPGFLHVYKSTRPLRLLYIDGMSAAKTTNGTLDTQDLLLLNESASHYVWWDIQRGTNLCNLSASFGVEGFIRMEAGFEIIKCNFSDGLEVHSVTRRPDFGSSESSDGLIKLFEYIRAVSNRYQDIGGSRVSLDYSSMVSAYFYDINMANPDPDQPLMKRLVFAGPEQLARIKSDLQDASQQPKPLPSVNWQGVVDMIVARYADRLQYIATQTSSESILREINILLNMFIDYDSPSIPSSIANCSSHYLTPAHPLSTTQDSLILAAILTVSTRICTTLFSIRDSLLHTQSATDVKAHRVATSAIRDLILWLDWTNWKKCGACDYDQVCFVAVWPFGAVEDHYKPSCRTFTQIADRRGYWGNIGPPRRDPGEGGGGRGAFKFPTSSILTYFIIVVIMILLFSAFSLLVALMRWMLRRKDIGALGSQGADDGDDN